MAYREAEEDRAILVVGIEGKVAGIDRKTGELVWTNGLRGGGLGEVEDEYGRDPALRYEDTSLLLFLLTMIAKRVEDGVHVDVREMFEQTRARIAELKDQVPRPQ